MKTIILFDNHDDYTFLEPLFDVVIYSPKYQKKFLSWLVGAWLALCKAKSDDLIVCWFDFQAVLLYWISLLIFQKRKIICLNILLKDKNTLKNKVVTWLYKIALTSPNFKATITSEEYGTLLNRKFKKQFQYVLLRDVFHDYTDVLPKQIKIEHNTIFCGGKNGRDWNFIVKLAKELPNIKFNIVVPKQISNDLNTVSIPNISLNCDIPFSEFLKLMAASEIVALPLDTEAPAGLIVMFQAAACNKLILTTDTATTRGYVGLNMGYRLPKDIDVWKNTIKKALVNKEESLYKALNFKKFLEAECNEKLFVNKVMDLINGESNN